MALTEDISKVLDFYKDYINKHDQESGYCYFHASFILKNLIPACHFMSDVGKESEDLKNVLVHEALRDRVLFTGSGAEGLYVPKFHKLPGSFEMPNDSVIADIDMMYLVQGIKVQDVGSESAGDVELVNDGCHPGYLRLKIMNKNLNLEEIEGPCTVTINEQPFLDSTKFHFDMYSKRDIQRDLRGTEVNENVFIHGPAVSSDITYTMPEFNFSRIISMDLVAALPCQFWPKSANSWIYRRRPSGWPSQRQIESIVSTGCHVVPVAHPTSKVRDIEWRLSFSAAELVLARSLTFDQRRCYMFLKLLCQEALVPKKVIPSYYLKTLLYWACEEYPESFWHENNLSCVLLTLLDILVHYLCKRCLPHYFLPENNLFSHIPSSTFSDLLHSLLKIRKDPIKILFEFNNRTRMESSRYPWQMTFKEVIADMQLQLVQPSLMKTLKNCAYCLHKMGFFNIIDINCKVAENAFLQMKPMMTLFSGITSGHLEFMSRQALCVPDELPESELVSYALSLRMFYWYLFKYYPDMKEQKIIKRDCGRLQLCLSSMERVYPWEEKGDEVNGQFVIWKNDDSDDQDEKFNDENIEEKGDDMASHHHANEPRVFGRDIISLGKKMYKEASDGIDTKEATPILCDIAMLHLLNHEYDLANQYALETIEKDSKLESPGLSMYGMLECCLFEDLEQQILEDHKETFTEPNMKECIHKAGWAVVPSVLAALLVVICAGKALGKAREDMKGHLEMMREIAEEAETPGCKALLQYAKVCFNTL